MAFCAITLNAFCAAARREQLATAVVQRVLATIIQGGKPRLTDGDLLALITDTSSVLMPRAGFEAALRNLDVALGGGQEQAPRKSPFRLRAFWSRSASFRSRHCLAERTDLTRDLLQRTRRNGTAFVTGSTGCGKNDLGSSHHAYRGLAVVHSRPARQFRRADNTTS